MACIFETSLTIVAIMTNVSGNKSLDSVIAACYCRDHITFMCPKLLALTLRSCKFPIAAPIFKCYAVWLCFGNYYTVFAKPVSYTLYEPYIVPYMSTSYVRIITYVDILQACSYHYYNNRCCASVYSVAICTYVASYVI